MFGTTAETTILVLFEKYTRHFKKKIATSLWLVGWFVVYIRSTFYASIIMVIEIDSQCKMSLYLPSLSFIRRRVFFIYIRSVGKNG